MKALKDRRRTMELRNGDIVVTSSWIPTESELCSPETSYTCSHSSDHLQPFGKSSVEHSE